MKNKLISRKIKKCETGTILPELVVMPRFAYIQYTGDETYPPTYEEFEEAQVDKARVESINKMLSLNGPIQPKVPGRLARGFQKINKFLGNPMQMSDKDAMNIFGYEKDPNACIYTVTSTFGHPVASNKTFLQNPYKYGFVPVGTPKEGDVMQLGDHHLMSITGRDENGNPTLTYASGNSQDPYVKDNDEFFYRDYVEPYRYYRFVGNEEDKKNWRKDYNKLYNK